MKYIEPENLRDRLASDKPLLLIDVRESEEFDAGHIEKAILIPWHELAKKITGIKPDKEIILYCHTGPRSLKAAKSLEDIGYKNVSVLKNGITGWDSKASNF